MITKPVAQTVIGNWPLTTRACATSLRRALEIADTALRFTHTRYGVEIALGQRSRYNNLSSGRATYLIFSTLTKRRVEEMSESVVVVNNFGTEFEERDYSLSLGGVSLDAHPRPWGIDLRV